MEYRRPDGRFPGEEQVRQILGDAAVDAVLQRGAGEASEAGPVTGGPGLRLVK